MVTGHFGQDPFRPYVLAETSPFSGTFRPRNMDVSAKKYGRFGQEMGTFRPRNMDVSAKIIVIIASDSARFCESNVEVPCYSITVGTFRGLTCSYLKLEIAQKSQYPSKEDR